MALVILVILVVVVVMVVLVILDILVILVILVVLDILVVLVILVILVVLDILVILVVLVILGPYRGTPPRQQLQHWVRAAGRLVLVADGNFVVFSSGQQNKKKKKWVFFVWERCGILVPACSFGGRRLLQATRKGVCLVGVFRIGSFKIWQSLNSILSRRKKKNDTRHLSLTPRQWRGGTLICCSPQSFYH